MHLYIHKSMHPGQCESRLRQSLEAGIVPPGELYRTPWQSALWLKLHETWSPARGDERIQKIYSRIFSDAANHLGGKPFHWISLGCGSGHKELQFLQTTNVKPVSSRMVDISSDLVITSCLRLRGHLSALGEVADLSVPLDVPAVDHSPTSGDSIPHLYFFLGMFPNMDPETAWSGLADLMGPDDLVLASFNMASNDEYQSELSNILPQYNNMETRNWISAFCDAFGYFDSSENIQFQIREYESDGRVLKYINAGLTAGRPWFICLPGGYGVQIDSGRELSLFRSFRYTLDDISDLAARYHLEIIRSHVDDSDQEGVFLFRKSKR